MNVASLQSKLDESQAKVESFSTQVTTLQVCTRNVYMYMYIIARVSYTCKGWVTLEFPHLQPILTLVQSWTL
jgi:hypothetical protein